MRRFGRCLNTFSDDVFMSEAFAFVFTFLWILFLVVPLKCIVMSSGVGVATNRPQAIWPVIILDMNYANGRRRYIATSPLIDFVHTQSGSWYVHHLETVSKSTLAILLRNKFFSYVNECVKIFSMWNKKNTHISNGTLFWLTLVC